MESFEEYFSSQELQQLRQQQPQNLPQLRGAKQNAPDVNNIESQQREIQEIIYGHIGVLKEERIIRKGIISTASWDSDNSYSVVTSQKGSYWNYFGKRCQDKMILNVEETLFLVEQGCLELYHGGIPMSVQQTFSNLIPCLVKMSFNHYLVYGYLLRLGYVVCRHQQRLSADFKKPLQTLDFRQSAQQSHDLECDHASCSSATLVQPRDAKTTASVLSKLQVIKTHRMDTVVPPSKGSYYNIDFDVYLPGAHFKKSDPGKPAFCISVCRYSDPPPSLAVLNNLAQQCHPVPLKFALTDNGTITINSLLDVELPVYVTNE
ncbi:uncharacterized protein LOC110248912 [Exaiptasia diaphana]|uniref:tRNA-splicing endonuclease subunit Sen54 N-terminal domain-containing protein n=1 Tax=Exaiptasia diaphana TaxID=2652724 RepID=A0A913XVX6_EXADI|nr:uncharacterized protein LOC110237907 [Exaiptasia diaphana]XP_020911137.1 uncharacterized protein LOC110248912 [Exaiptasia diaphana]KXJ08375.1 tRNA-splicing endonuclease subunit Sen54 [Exaiptasia diaphana]KXJ15111.1 tRNA-splicing endonuclease subunit Sen54 [Exaiptasia diaphana]